MFNRVLHKTFYITTIKLKIEKKLRNEFLDYEDRITNRFVLLYCKIKSYLYVKWYFEDVMVTVNVQFTINRELLNKSTTIFHNSSKWFFTKRINI